MLQSLPFQRIQISLQPFKKKSILPVNRSRNPCSNNGAIYLEMPTSEGIIVHGFAAEAEEDGALQLERLGVGGEGGAVDLPLRPSVSSHALPVIPLGQDVALVRAPRPPRPWLGGRSPSRRGCWSRWRWSAGEAAPRRCAGRGTPRDRRVWTAVYESKLLP